MNAETTAGQDDFCIRRSGRFFLFCVLMLGLTIRIWRIMDHELPDSDGSAYLFYAKYYLDLLQGKTDVTLILDWFVKPGYMLLGMLVMFVIGCHKIVFHVVNLFFGVINILLVFNIASRIGRQPTGYIAAVCAATYPIIVIWDRSGIAHTVSGTFLLLAVLWYVKGIQANRRNGMPCGLFAGLAAIVHPTLIFYGFLFGASEVVYVLITRSLNKSLRFAVNFTLFAALPLLAMEVVYKLIYWAVPALRRNLDVPLWHDGYFYELYLHHEGSTILEAGWPLFLKNLFEPYQGSMVACILIVLGIILFLFKMVISRSQDAKVCHGAVLLLTFAPILFWSLVYPTESRVLYPAYLLLCVVYGLGASVPLDLLDRLKSQRLYWGVTLGLCLLLAAGIARTSPSWQDWQNLTHGQRTGKVLTTIRDLGYKRVLFFGEYLTWTWLIYMPEVFGYDMYRIGSDYYPRNIKALLKRIDEEDMEGIIFLNEKRYQASVPSTAFAGFAEKNGLIPVPLFKEGSNPLPHVEFYDIRQKALKE